MSDLASTYFEYPWRGQVYAIEVPEEKLRKGGLVRIPNGDLVKVTVEEGYFPCVEKMTGTERELGLPTVARLVIPEGEFEQNFTGAWGQLIERINAAAAVNTLYSVILPLDEYRRLEQGGLERMRQSFSEQAFSLLHLYENYLEKGPSLQLFHNGRCP